MERAGLCSICGKVVVPARSCLICGIIVCSSCSSEKICQNCRLGRK